MKKMFYFSLFMSSLSILTLPAKGAWQEKATLEEAALEKIKLYNLSPSLSMTERKERSKLEAATTCDLESSYGDYSCSEASKFGPSFANIVKERKAKQAFEKGDYIKTATICKDLGYNDCVEEALEHAFKKGDYITTAELCKDLDYSDCLQKALDRLDINKLDISYHSDYDSYYSRLKKLSPETAYALKARRADMLRAQGNYAQAAIIYEELEREEKTLFGPGSKDRPSSTGTKPNKNDL